MQLSVCHHRASFICSGYKGLEMLMFLYFYWRFDIVISPYSSQMKHQRYNLILLWFASPFILFWVHRNRNQNWSYVLYNFFVLICNPLEIRALSLLIVFCLTRLHCSASSFKIGINILLLVCWLYLWIWL